MRYPDIFLEARVLMRQKCYETCRLREPFLFPSPQRQLVCNPVSNPYSFRKILSFAHGSWPCGHLLWFRRGLSPIDSCVLKLGPQLEGFSRTLWYVYRRWDFSRSGYWGMGALLPPSLRCDRTTFVSTSTEPRAVCSLHWVPYGACVRYLATVRKCSY